MDWSYGSNHRCIVCKFAIVEDVFSVLEILANIKHNHACDDEYALCRLSEYSWHFRLFFSKSIPSRIDTTKYLCFHGHYLFLQCRIIYQSILCAILWESSQHVHLHSQTICSSWKYLKNITFMQNVVWVKRVIK